APRAPDPEDASHLVLTHRVQPRVVAGRLDHDLVAADTRHLAERGDSGAGDRAPTGQRRVQVRDDAHLPRPVGGIAEDLGRGLVLVARAERTEGIERRYVGPGNGRVV